MKKILVATDLSARSDRAVLRAIKLAKEFNASLTILHIIDDEVPRGIIENAKELAKKEINLCLKNKTKDIKPEIRIISGEAYAQILKIVNDENIDLIVLGLHRHTKKDQPMIGNVIQRLLKFSHKPLLIVKDRSENNYSKILSVIDLKANSKRSLKEAFKIFNKGKFYLLHSYQVPFLGFMGNSPAIEKQVISDCKQDLQEIADELLKDDKSGKEIEQIIKKGYILEVLQEEVQYLNPDLLVMGNHSRSEFATSVVSSATDNVLLDPPCDVLVVS